MSRARNIKPGFFKNDLLAECSPLARILFVGLWCEADREGRLEDRVKRIKADCLPYDDCDVSALLNELDVRGFICRYEANGSRYIAIPEFKKHQNPHCKEQDSSIPAPCMHGASTVQEQGKSRESTEVARLIPDSPSLIPETIEKQKGGKPPALTLPDWLPATAWDDWHAFRNSRKGWTTKARELSLATLTKLHAKGHDPTAVIEQSIERGWTGLFEIKTDTGNAHGNFQPGRKLSAVEQVEQAIQNRRARESLAHVDPVATLGYG
jgi:hypothetical protein